MRASSIRRRRRQARVRTLVTAVMRIALVTAAGLIAVTILLFVASLVWALVT